MHSFLRIDPDGPNAYFHESIGNDYYIQANKGRYILLQFREDGHTLIWRGLPDAVDCAKGHWVTVANDPVEIGVYLVTTEPGEAFCHTKVACWHGDHWRTPNIGRIDGDNRIPAGRILKWKRLFDK